jgi:hypothetical protein
MLNSFALLDGMREKDKHVSFQHSSKKIPGMA